MRCLQCGHDNAVEMKFCGECGTGLAVLCHKCDARNTPVQKFCGECGARLESGASSRQHRSPASYTPWHLAEKILTSKTALEGERKQVTVLFADLKGSMELLADRDPEDGRKLVDPVLTLMMDAVHHYEGTVNQVMGDGIMALFGAPLAQEDHAHRACYAALRMQELVKRYAEDARRAYGVNVQIRVGLNSGQVVVRSIGSDLHMDYTAVGETTHLAARMEQRADPGAIVITRDTLALVEGFVEVKPLGPTPIKGVPGLIEVYELVGFGGVRTRLQATVARGLTQFVGRDAELALLRRALDDAHAGHGQVIAIVGEPGLGKSRLVFEFLQNTSVDDWLVLQGGALSHGHATPYLPVIDLLRSFFTLSDQHAHDDIREKIAWKLGFLSLPLLSLLDVPIDDLAWQSLDPLLRRRRILEALKNLVLEESQRRPLLLVFEDLQWVDSATQVFLDTLVESIPRAPILLLVNYRPEYQHTWTQKTFYAQIRIDPLDTHSVKALLDTLLGEDPSLAPLIEAPLVKRTEGNPFFLEETIRALVETGVLSGERGSYRLTRPIGGVRVPATVQTVLAGRIDRLPVEEKSLLQIASVIGKDVPLSLLQAIAELPDDELQHRVSRLQATEFLYETRSFSEPGFTFKHALTHEVTYGSLLKSSRKSAHLRIAGVLVDQFPDTLATRPELVAHHYSEAAVHSEALRYWQRAGERARERSANLEAVAHLSKGLEALEAHSESHERNRHEAELQIALAQAFHALKGQAAPEVARAYARARDLCEQVEDAPLLFRVLLGLYRSSGSARQGRGIVEQLYNLAQSVQDPDLLLEAHMAQGTVLCLVGELAAARVHLEQAVARYEPRQHRSHALHFSLDPGVVSLSRLSWNLWLLGYPEQALRRSEEALALAREQAPPNSLANALHFAATLHQIRRETAAVKEMVEATLAVANEHDLTQWQAAATFMRGWTRTMDGPSEAGLAEMHRGLAAYRATGTGMDLPWYLGTLAVACGKTGRADEGIAMVAEALVSTEGADFYEAELHRLHGELRLLKSIPDADHAEACFRQALTVARNQQAKSWELRAAMSLGRLWVNQGKRSDARKLIKVLYDWFTEGFETPDLRDAKSFLNEVSVSPR
jgi:class 3 adenylate cyclase/predicted ATPase